MTFLFLLLKPLLIMLVKKVFKKQMKVFAVEMLQEYALASDNDVSIMNCNMKLLRPIAASR